MGKLLETYLRYGIPTDEASKYEAVELSVSTFRVTPINKLVEHYGISSEEASWVKQCITRQPIQEEVVQKLLENSNFVCCCCKGIKGDSYIIHHIVEYEISQNNSYENLAVLCPNDHDLAHRSPSLTNKLTPNQIRKSKENWEKEVCLHNLATSLHGEREEFLLKLPRYQKLQSEIDLLKERIGDKEKLITRSEAFFNDEISKLHNQIAELESQTAFLEQQVENITQKLISVDFSQVSELYSEAISCFLDGDLSGAITVLDEAELDAELEKTEKLDEELNESLRKNADSRLFKATLLTLDFRFSEAQQSAGKALQLYERLADRNPEKYLFVLAFKFEAVGSVYYNTGEYEASEACFVKGISVSQALYEMGIYAHVPLYALLVQNIGASYYSRDEYETAKIYLEEANLWYEDFSKVIDKIPLDNQELVEPLLLDFKYYRAMATTNLGTTYKALGMYDKAIEFLLKGKNIYEDLVFEKPSRDLDGLREILSTLGSFYNSSGDIVAAKEVYLKLLPIVQNLFEKHRSRHIEEFADLLLDLCSICVISDEANDARGFCCQALNLYREFATSRGEKAEIQMASALMYLVVLPDNEQVNDFDKCQLASEAKSICVKYPSNSEAKKLIEVAQQFLDLVKSKN